MILVGFLDRAVLQCDFFLVGFLDRTVLEEFLQQFATQTLRVNCACTATDSPYLPVQGVVALFGLSMDVGLGLVVVGLLWGST